MIVGGNLVVKRMSQRQQGDQEPDKTRHRHQQNSRITGRFTQFLAYKTRKTGKRVIRVSERNTSNQYCHCSTKTFRPLAERFIHWESCELLIDRDINAVVNLLQQFLAVLWHLLSHQRPVVGQPLPANGIEQLHPLQLLLRFQETFYANHP